MIIIIITIIIIIIITIIIILALISYAVPLLFYRLRPLPPTLRLGLQYSAFKIREMQRKQKWENISIFYYSYSFKFSSF